MEMKVTKRALKRAYCQVLGPQGVDARQVAPHGGSVELLHLLLKLLGHPLLLLVLLGVCKLHHHGGGTALEEAERERGGGGGDRERDRPNQSRAE